MNIRTLIGHCGNTVHPREITTPDCEHISVVMIDPIMRRILNLYLMGYTARVKVLKMAGGVLLILIGLIALVTPLTPGAWLMFVGLELIGVRLTMWDKIKEWINKRRNKNTLPLDTTADTTTTESSSISTTTIKDNKDTSL